MAQSNWYIKTQGKRIGPLSTEQLKQILDQFREDSETQVLKEGWKNWQRAVDLVKYLQGSGDFSSGQAKTVSTLPVKNQDWYVYIDKTQHGPCTMAKINEYLAGRSNKEAIYLFHRAWKEWRHLLEVPASLLNGEALVEGNSQAEDDRRQGGKRAGIAGNVIAHNDQVVSVVAADNISMSGMFLASNDNLFFVGEIIKLTIKCPKLAAPFHAKAEIVRFGTNDRGQSGYGLKFVGLNSLLERNIEKFVANIDGAGSYASAS